MDLGLGGAAAVVVGGSRGMGVATARCLAEEGARVAVVGRSRSDAESAAASLSECGSPDAVGLVADVRDGKAVADLFEELGKRWGGGLNVLVNTVGPNAQGAFDVLTDDQWRDAVEDGVMSMVRSVRSALPFLRAAQWARRSSSEDGIADRS